MLIMSGKLGVPSGVDLHPNLLPPPRFSQPRDRPLFLLPHHLHPSLPLTLPLPLPLLLPLPPRLRILWLLAKAAKFLVPLRMMAQK